MYFYLVVVLLGLLDQLVVDQVSGKGHGGDAKTREGRLESVDAGELTLVSPRVSLGPGIAAHGSWFGVDYSQTLLLVGRACANRDITGWDEEGYCGGLGGWVFLKDVVGLGF